MIKFGDKWINKENLSIKKTSQENILLSAVKRSTLHGEAGQYLTKFFVTVYIKACNVSIGTFH